MDYRGAGEWPWLFRMTLILAIGTGAPLVIGIGALLLVIRSGRLPFRSLSTEEEGRPPEGPGPPRARAGRGACAAGLGAAWPWEAEELERARRLAICMAEEARRAAEREGERRAEEARRGEAAAARRVAAAERAAADATAAARKAAAELEAARAEAAALRQAAAAGRPQAVSAAAALAEVEAGLPAMGRADLSALVARLGALLAAASQRLAAAPRERECAVCLTVKAEEHMRVLHPCMHGFCEECVARLQAGGSPCPRCRRPFARASRVFVGDAPSGL
eukprot:tig00000053_g23495.t1